MKNYNISQKVTISTILVLFSGLLIFVDQGGDFMYGIPRELIVPIYIIQLCLAPAYLRKYKYAYIIGALLSIFIAFTYRDATIIARFIPILQYFLVYFSILAYREIKEGKNIK